MGMGTTAKWSDIRRSKVAPDQEGAAAASAQALRDALALGQLRADRGVTQIELAEWLGKSQGNVSEIEHRKDVYLSTLREYIEALGGRLEVAAVFEDDRRIVNLGEALAASVAAQRDVGQMSGVGSEPNLTKGRVEPQRRRA